MYKVPVVIACVITLFFGYFALFIRDRSPLENLLTDEENAIFQGNEYVRSKTSEQFNPTDASIYLIDTKQPGWAQTLCNFERYASQFGTVFGLCTTPYFYIEHTIDSVINEPIDMVHDELPFIVNGVPPSDWKKRLEENTVLRSFTADNVRYVISAVFLPQTESELAQAERAVKILQMGKGISWYRILDLDVHSLWQGIIGADWVLGRYLIHVMLIASTMLLALFGVGIVLLLGFRSIFGNWRLSWIAIMHIWAALICQLGAMTLLDIHRSVFTLVAQMIPFLVGTSIMPEVFEKREKARRPYQWATALTLVGAATYVFPYIGIEVRHVHEFAYAVMLGAFFMAAFALYSFPYFLRNKDLPRNVVHSRVNRISAYFSQKCYGAAQWFSRGARLHSSLTLFVILFCVTMWLVSSGNIKTATDSNLYIKGTSIAKGLDIINKPGGPGQVFVEAILECKHGGTFNDPWCAREMIFWHRAVETTFARAYPELRTTSSMAKYFDSVAIGTKKEPGIIARVPQTKADIAAVWPNIKTRLSQFDRQGMPTFQSQFWCKNDDCFRVMVGISIVTDAESNRVITALQKFNEEKFPNLTITFYGKNALFSQLGRYVTEGKVKNTFASTASVGIMFFVFLTVLQWGALRKLSPLKGGFAAMIPFIFAPSVFLFLLWISNGVLDVVAATVSSFAIAAAGDFMALLMYVLVQNIRAYPKLNLYDVLELTLHEEGPLRVRDMLLNVGSFSVFAICVIFQPVQMLGIAMMLITFLCLVGTLVFSMAILMRMLRQAKPLHAQHCAPSE